jgi:hypothetical protein
MAITTGMKSLLWGLAGAVALAGLGSDASAGVKDEALRARAAAGATHGMTLAKAKKRRRPAAPGAKSGKAAPVADDDAGDADDASASSGSSDEAKEEEVFGSKKRKKAVAADEGDAGDEGAPPKAARSRPKMDAADETVEAKASQPEEGEGGTPVGSALEFGLGGKALFRNFVWSGGTAVGLGPYALTPGPETAAWLEFYPAAFGTTGFAANVGLLARLNYGFGVATTLANGDVVATTFRDYLAGLKIRIPLGTFIPNLSLAYGQQLFQIDQQQTGNDLPKLAYSFVRPALGARVMFTPTVSLDLAFGYLAVLDPGSGADHIRSSRFFPNTTSYGIDASASLGIRLAGAIGARAGLDWRQYGLALNPDASTRNVRGAVDRYITVWLGVEVVLDGLGAAGGDDDDAKPSKRKRRRAEPKEDDESEGDGDKSEKSDDEG